MTQPLRTLIHEQPPHVRRRAFRRAKLQLLKLRLRQIGRELASDWPMTIAALVLGLSAMTLAHLC